MKIHRNLCAQITVLAAIALLPTLAHADGFSAALVSVIGAEAAAAFATIGAYVYVAVSATGRNFRRRKPPSLDTSVNASTVVDQSKE